MIVLDPSVTVRLAAAWSARSGVDAVLLEPGQHVAVPHLWSAEVTQVLRWFERAGDLSPQRADLARVRSGRYEQTDALTNRYSSGLGSSATTSPLTTVSTSLWPKPSKHRW